MVSLKFSSFVFGEFDDFAQEFGFFFAVFWRGQMGILESEREREQEECVAAGWVGGWDYHRH